MSTDTPREPNVGGRLSLLGPALVLGLHLLALVALPPDPALVTLVGLEAVSLLLCALSLVGGGSTARTTLVCWLVALGLYGVVALARRGTDTLALVALALVTTGTLIGYGFHRYERVRLGLVSESR